MGSTSFQRTNYSGYLVSTSAVLAALADAGITPAHERVIAEHVTFRYPDPDPAPPVESCVLVGYLCDDGVDCVTVALDGVTVRPDGSRFHITVSVAPGHAPVESNALCRSGAEVLLEPVPLAVTPF